MTIQVPNGAVVSIASTYGAAKVMSAITSANPAVATLAPAHGIVVNDILEVTSGWSKLNSRIAKASVVATNDVTLAGINASSVTAYPAGAGVGTVRAITAWTQLAQILSSASEGGDQQFQTYQFLESDSEFRIPTVKSAQGLKFSVGDDPASAGQILAQAANDDKVARAVRIALPGGGMLYYNAFITVGQPTLNQNEIMAVEVTLSLIAAVTRY
ncbi:MAG: phage tail protein [Pseudomonadota bacterium]